VSRALVVSLLGLALTLASCGPDASDPFSRLTVYDEPGGAYRVRYLKPPWELASSEGTSLTLRIISTTEAYTGIAETGVPDKYVLDVTVMGGGAAAHARADATAATRRGEEIIEPVREVTTRSGDTGFELVTRAEMPEVRSHRFVYLDRTGGGVVRLHFEANPQLNRPEVDEMVRAVDVDPE
jgi:hypothetical protein